MVMAAVKQYESLSPQPSSHGRRYDEELSSHEEYPTGETIVTSFCRTQKGLVDLNLYDVVAWDSVGSAEPHRMNYISVSTSGESLGKQPSDEGVSRVEIRSNELLDATLLTGMYGFWHVIQYPVICELPELLRPPLAASTIDSLETCFTFRERDAAVSFIEKNRFLLPLLGDIFRNAGKHISISEAFLYVIIDPESGGFEQLVISILSDMDPLQADESMERFEDEWWLDNVEKAHGKLVVTLEFR